MKNVNQTYFQPYKFEISFAFFSITIFPTGTRMKKKFQDEKEIKAILIWMWIRYIYVYYK